MEGGTPPEEVGMIPPLLPTQRGKLKETTESRRQQLFVPPPLVLRPRLPPQALGPDLSLFHELCSQKEFAIWSNCPPEGGETMGLTK